MIQTEEPEESGLVASEGIGTKLARIAWRALEIAALLTKAIGDIERPCTRCRRPFPLRDLPAWQFTSSGPYHPVCRECYAILKAEREQEIVEARECRVLQKQLYRAVLNRRVATLTLSDWIETLDHYNWRCAYCASGAYEVMEHLIPISQGGGTTVDNCAPACRSCNARKRDHHPDVIV
jgi:hypothetical protein